MTDPQRIICAMACLESLRNHQGYLIETIGSHVKLRKLMPQYRGQLLDAISKLDVVAGGIKEALDVMMEEWIADNRPRFLH